MSSAPQNVDTSLQKTFLQAQFMAAIGVVLNSDDRMVNDATLTRLETLAHQGCYKAQETLANLYNGEDIFSDSDPYLPDEQHNPERAVYWAMQAGASPECTDYAAIDMARILIKSERPDCRLRVLSLLIKAQTSTDHTARDSALDMVQILFADFNLEQFVAAYKPPIPMELPAPAPSPQSKLF